MNDAKWLACCGITVACVKRNQFQHIAFHSKSSTKNKHSIYIGGNKQLFVTPECSFSGMVHGQTALVWSRGDMFAKTPDIPRSNQQVLIHPPGRDGCL